MRRQSIGSGISRQVPAFCEHAGCILLLDDHLRDSSYSRYQLAAALFDGGIADRISLRVSFLVLPIFIGSLVFTDKAISDHSSRQEPSTEDSQKSRKRISHPESVKTQHIHNLILIQRTIYFGLSAVKMIRFFIVSARKNPCRLFYEDIFLLLKSKSMPFGQAWHVSRASAGTRSIRAAKR